MELFGRFKNKKDKKKNNVNESINALKEAMETLDKREKYLVNRIKISESDAKKNIRAGNKKAAIRILGRKQMLTTQIDKIYGKKSNIEHQIIALESASGNKDVIEAMKKGNKALKSYLAETDVDKVDDVMDDIYENVQHINEIDEAMGQSIGKAYDDDELEKELEMLAEGDLGKDEVVTDKTLDIEEEESSKEKEEKSDKTQMIHETEEEKEERELKELEREMMS